MTASKNKLRELGSKTAKNGFKNEHLVINKFNNWQKDNMAQNWLKTMGYKISEIEYVKAVKITGSYKADIQVQIQVTVKLKEEFDCQNISIKLVSNLQGFNQIDKRWIDKYIELWSMEEQVSSLLKFYTGEKAPYKKDTRDLRRMFANEFSQQEQNTVLEFLKNNKTIILTDIIKGRGKFSAEWFLVIYKDCEKWVLKPINFVLNYYAKKRWRRRKRFSQDATIQN